MSKHKVSVETTVRRGFPVIVKGHLCPAEPDVGLMSEGVEDMEVLTLNGKPADFLKLTERELEKLADDFLQGIH
jgi:hypothetical protein